jgi:hypothetical protein
MTLPHEELQALLNARAFLVDLLDPKATPRVSKAIRERAYWCLRHYPWDFAIKERYKV